MPGRKPKHPKRESHAALEGLFRSLLESAPDAMVIVDQAGRIVLVNAETERLFGYGRHELLGQPVEMLVPTRFREDHPGHRQNYFLAPRALSIGIGMELYGLRKNGTEFPVEIRLSPLATEEGVLVSSAIRDITARKQVEQQLWKAQERLTHVLSSSPAVLYTLRVEGARLAPGWVSDNVEEVIGYAPAEISGPTWFEERVYPEDRERVLSQVGELLAANHVEREFRFRRRDGEYVWIRDVQKLLRDSSGRPQEVVGSWWEVGDRKRAELRLAESEAQYRLLFDHNPHPMWVFDVETLAFLAVNDAAVRHYGYSREEFLRMTLSDIRPLEEIPALLEDLKATAGLEGAVGLWKHRLKDGSVRLVEIVTSRLLFEGRSAKLVLATDLTEKVTLEEQLLQAQKMEAIGQLAGGVAHDFNNLLGVILGYASLLIRDLGAQHPGIKRAEEIRRAAERAADLTRQLLAFSRKQLLEAKVLELNGVVVNVEVMLQRLIGEDVHLVTRLGDGVGRVRADPGQLEQVIVNLAVNARDAMLHGGRLVLETANVDHDEGYARVHPDVKPGPYVMLAVSDTGHGMDPATMAHIFEPFFTTKAKGKGTGLGLATVFGIVKQSGGHLSVHSEPGQGTTFKVYLPRAEEPAAPSLPEAPAAPSAGGTETILLVEDAEALRSITREILEEAGYRVIPAADPAEALSVAASHETIHLLLTDVVMPGMSGRRLADKLLELGPAVRVVYMSGYTDAALDKHGALETGIHFLAKPFAAAALLRKLRAVLDDK